MKRIFCLVVLLLTFTLAVIGCSSDGSVEKEPVSESVIEINEPKWSTNEDDKGTEEIPETTTVPITKEDFDSRYKRDSEESQYENSKTELKDGTVLNVDEIVYSNDESFDYVIATFHEGNLVHLQVETSKSKEESLNGLGLSENDYVRIKPSPSMTGIFDVVIDERFADENIAVFPSEW